MFFLPVGTWKIIRTGIFRNHYENTWKGRENFSRQNRHKMCHFSEGYAITLPDNEMKDYMMEMLKVSLWP